MKNAVFLALLWINYFGAVNHFVHKVSFQPLKTPQVRTKTGAAQLFLNSHYLPIACLCAEDLPQGSLPFAQLTWDPGPAHRDVACHIRKNIVFVIVLFCFLFCIYYFVILFFVLYILFLLLLYLFCFVIVIVRRKHCEIKYFFSQ